MDSSLAISARGLTKQYRVGAHVKFGSFREVAQQRLTAPVRALRSRNGAEAADPEVILAVNDVSFDVREGEVLGLVGRNGSGKTTILKMLSRITEPTSGSVQLRGRVGSLLEVGTGFHPELTGRENVFLNGAILGMHRNEIRRQFNDIVEFAEVERFIDTPVKRYSSGMYVRLAFAVAAHFQPEVLIVDEVLAVGDVEFQKKCMGRMGEVAQEGRTVLFVSHNLGAVRRLCDRALLLERGVLIDEGTPQDIIGAYLARAGALGEGEYQWSADPIESDLLSLRTVRTVGPLGTPQAAFEGGQPIAVELEYALPRPLRGARISLYVLTADGEVVFVSSDERFAPHRREPGLHRSTCVIPAGLLNRRTYLLAVRCDIPGVKEIVPMRECLSFAVVSVDIPEANQADEWPGLTCPDLEWDVARLAPAEYRQGPTNGAGVAGP